MPFLKTEDRPFLEAVSKLAYANPFLPEMVNWEREALGGNFAQEESVWNFTVEDPERVHTNSWRILDRLEKLLPELRQSLARGVRPTPKELSLYEDALLYRFYFAYYERMMEATFHKTPKSTARWSFYRDFRDEWRDYFEIPGLQMPPDNEARHTFACFYQILRAFHNIFPAIIGASLPAARLRAAVWQSVFTHDIRRYRRVLYPRMNEFATLITGPSGSGKELVARSIAMSRYVPFDEKKLTFEADLDALVYPINIAALPGTLVESELFGHRRGSFTGAVQDKRGWFELCPELGAVFLDEIGELDPEIQVKLLRVIETRSFQPLGEASGALQRFRGKLIAATNRNLPLAIRKKRFREDLYYRLCSDQISTPSLRQQLDDSTRVLEDLVLFMSLRIAGDDGAVLAKQALAWIKTNLPPDYAWPGNYRELEQCLRNFLIRREYAPFQIAEPVRGRDPFAEAREGKLTAEELLCRYCRLVYKQTGSYEETARRLGLDRRTVKAKVTSAAT
jgi:transcriptional regulator with AAA-type ATPase domain